MWSCYTWEGKRKGRGGGSTEGRALPSPRPIPNLCARLSGAKAPLKRANKQIYQDHILI